MADGADLDYETTPSYELNLSVTDKVDHEHNFDPYSDDVLIVRIDLVDQAPGMIVQADRTSLKVGEWLNFTTRYEPAPEDVGRENIAYQLEEYIGMGGDAGHRHALWHVLRESNSPPGASTWSATITESSAGTKTYRASVELLPGDDDLGPPTYVDSEEIEITWEN